VCPAVAISLARCPEHGSYHYKSSGQPGYRV